jgi:dihydrofolate reductase
MRPRCSVFIATSLDGFIARRDGSVDWLSVVERPGEDYGYAHFFAGVDALVMGRRTYDTARGFPSWPYGGKRCVVLTHDPPEARHGEQFHAGPPLPLLEQLHADGIRHIYVDGGAVIRQFLASDLIDDFTLSIVPVLLGDGIRLFEDGGPGKRLRLEASQAFPSGLVQTRYQSGD